MIDKIDRAVFLLYYGVRWLLLGTPALLLTFPALAAEQAHADIPAKKEHSAYQQDSRGMIVRNRDGLCWRSGYWNEEDSVAGCDGPITPPISKIIAPPLPHQPPPAVTGETTAATLPTRPATPSCEFSLTLDGDSSFSFNGARLNAMAQRQIATEVLPRLAACPASTLIRITGHTDRLGAPQYNHKLSLRRARAVASFLRQQGVQLQMEEIGAGASQAQQECSLPQNPEALLACLAPDRRVTIEVHGTQD